MILSNTEIHSALNSGRLVIDPEPSPRIPQTGKYCPYDTHSVDLRLHNEIRVPLEGTFIYDLSQEGSLAELIARNSKKITLTDDQPYPLKRGKFVLARTFEKVVLPIHGARSLAARIEGKSSRARCGVLVHFTAPTVHPGWEGRLTLEMINLGPADFMLRPRMPIAQLIVEEVLGVPIENPSQFQGQNAPEGVVESDGRAPEAGQT